MTGLGRVAAKFGAFAVVSLLLLMLLVNTMVNGLGGDARTYDAVFSDVSGLRVSTVAEAVGIFDEDVYAKNTKDDQNRVVLKPVDAELADGVLTLTLPPISWTAVSLTA